MMSTSYGGSLEAGDVVIVDFVGRRFFPSENDDGDHNKNSTNNRNSTDTETETESSGIAKSDADVEEYPNGSGQGPQGGEIFHEAVDWMITIGDKEVTPALEMGIRFMRIGERSHVYSHPKYAYGPQERTNPKTSYVLPPHSHVWYEIHVKSLFAPPSSSPSSSSSSSSSSTTTTTTTVPPRAREGGEDDEDDFHIQCALSKKRIGNDVFANEWSRGQGKSKALLLYKKAADAMTQVLASSSQKQQERPTPNGSASAAASTSTSASASASAALEIQIDCLNNMAAVLLRAGEYSKCKEAATQVLMRDPDNVKALLRAARSTMLDIGSTLEESEAAIVAAEEQIIVAMPADDREGQGRGADDDDDNDEDNPTNAAAEKEAAAAASRAQRADVRRLRAELEARKRAYKKKSQAIMSKMSKALGGGNKASSSPNTSSERSKTRRAVASSSAGSSSENDDDDNNNKVGEECGEEESKRGRNAEDAGRNPDHIGNDKPKGGSDLRLGTSIIFQLVLPFITFGLFLWMKRHADARRAAEELDIPVHDDDGTFS